MTSPPQNKKVPALAVRRQDLPQQRLHVLSQVPPRPHRRRALGCFSLGCRAVARCAAAPAAPADAALRAVALTGSAAGGRCEGVEHFLAAALPAIRKRKFKKAKGVIEFAMNVRDWPQEVDRKHGLPLFSFSKKIGNQVAPDETVILLHPPLP